MFILNINRLCKIRCFGQTTFVKHFNRQAKKSTKWPMFQNKEIKLSDNTSPEVGFKSLLKPFIFTVSFSGCCFVAASIWQYEEMRKTAHFMKNYVFLESPYSVRYKRLEIRRHINNWWDRQSQGEKLALCIAGINLSVLLLWRIPACYPFMRRYFCASPAMNATCLPMILSTYSHHSFFHFAANMYVLYSFSSTSVAFLGKEQFLALYSSAGVISSFTSYVYKVVTGRFATSLGASGALMAILSSCCFQFPHAQLAIIFLPFFTFSAGSAIKAVMAFDLIGLIARWKLFDHAAHLGGALCGILYLLYGRTYIWDNRGHIFRWYQKIREKKE